jgi:hypothetical protein
VASAGIGASISTFSLLGWTIAIIVYISTTYQPSMGFWAVMLLAIAVVSAPFVAFGVFRCSHCCSCRAMVVPYVLAALALSLAVSAKTLAITWIQASLQSFLLTYGLLTALMTLPACLLGFAVSGPIVWLGLTPQLLRRTIACTRVRESGGIEVENLSRVPGDA